MFTSNSFYIASMALKLIAKNDYSVTSEYTIRYKAYKDIYQNFALIILHRHIFYAIFKG